MSVSAACLPVEGDTVHLESDTDAAVALMTVRGVWTRQLWQNAGAALRKCLGEHPEAVIVDLSGLDDPRGASAAMWVDAQCAAALMEPPVQLALCIPPELPLADLVQRIGTRHHLPVHAKVRQARVAIAGRLRLAERLMLRLPSGPEVPSLARDLVTDACLTWGLNELLHPGRVVMSELVTNAVEHAGTDLTVVVGRRGPGLHLTVADEVPVPPRLIPRARPKRGLPLDERGRGLQTVAQTATAWGTLPTRTGKVVWATLQPRNDVLPRPRRSPPRNDGPMPRAGRRTVG